MKNLIIFGCIGIACFSLFRGSSSEVPFPQTVIKERSGVKDLPHGERLRVILFTGTTWCPACKTLDSSVISKDAWKEYAEKEIIFTSYDIPRDRSLVSERASSQMQEFGIRSFPTIILLSNDFEKIDQFVGAGPPVENFKTWIRAHSL